MFLFLCSIKMSSLSLNELKQIAKTIRIKNYKNNTSKEELLSALDKLLLKTMKIILMILEQKRLPIDF